MAENSGLSYPGLPVRFRLMNRQDVVIYLDAASACARNGKLKRDNPAPKMRTKLQDTGRHAPRMGAETG
jgi:hypothetical protein